MMIRVTSQALNKSCGKERRKRSFSRRLRKKGRDVTRQLIPFSGSRHRR